MKLDDALRLAAEVHRLTGHKELVVIGSNAVLGVAPHTPIPAEMSMSADLDAYLRHDPDRTGSLVAHLGEDSEFHRRTGTFLDVVGPGLVTAPDGWETRMIAVTREALRLWFLDPCDAAVSKLARGEPRDLRWVRAGLEAGIISEPVLRARMSATRFLDADEERRAFGRLDAVNAEIQARAPRGGAPDLGF